MESVTGRLPPAEREARIDSLTADGGRFVLVCTDCLSEGVNLQEHFDAVLHYDLAWNPTRHEQREGRVDRFGQEKREVRAITYYGADNPIDGVILDVLIRKHKSIKNDLGVTVAVPGSGEQIAEALFEGALFREQAGAGRYQLALDFIDDLDAETRAIHAEWENARDREKASRSRFAQHGLKPEAVAAELEHVRAAIGRSEDVARFFTAVLRAANVPVRVRATNGAAGVADIADATNGRTRAHTDSAADTAGGRTRTHANGAAGKTSADARTHTNGTDDVASPVDAASAASPANGKPDHGRPDHRKPDHGRITVHVSSETPRALRQAIGQEEPFTGRFDLPLPEGEIHLGRMSPVVEGLASWTLDQALDPESRDAAGSVASRCGAIVTSAVSARTTLLVARFRYHLRRAAAGTGSGHGGEGPGFNEPGHGGPGHGGAEHAGPGPRSGAGGDTILCEEIAPLACTGPAEAPQWLSPEEGERLLPPNPSATCCLPPSSSNSACCCRPCPGSRSPLNPSRTNARKPSVPRMSGCVRLPARGPRGEEAGGGAASPSNLCCPWTSWAPTSCCRSCRRYGPEPNRPNRRGPPAQQPGTVPDDPLRRRIAAAGPSAAPDRPPARSCRAPGRRTTRSRPASGVLPRYTKPNSDHQLVVAETEAEATGSTAPRIMARAAPFQAPAHAPAEDRSAGFGLRNSRNSELRAFDAGLQKSGWRRPVTRRRGRRSLGRGGRCPTWR